MYEPLIVGLHGTLERHPWISEDDPDGDAYGLFSAQADAFGLALPFDRRHEPSAAGAWYMEEAEHTWTVGPSDSLVFWAQVGIPPLTPPRPLPVQAAVTCAERAARRLGHLAVSGVQVEAPDLGRTAWSDLAETAELFRNSDPQSASTASVTVHGHTRENDARLSKAIRELRIYEHKGFTFATHAGDEPTELTPASADPRTLADESAHFAVRLPEWSPDSASWVAAATIAACRWSGVTGTLPVSIARRAP